ncbi:hypothetical protein DNTS_007092 [Danionella cerebrum]|uniref:Protein FAM151A n=1 Tax=Danionella cerebrum TaxID=2873325 RepID=A0A553QC85_9TELE|nr:hypothetical protein DNTS_007092 [Danionella translucida]
MEDKKQENYEDDEDGERKEEKRILGIFTREQFNMLCVALGLITLLLIITLTSVFVSRKADASVETEMELFPSDGDMLDFLIQTGEIKEKDGLYATWYHSANSKSEMNKALNSEVMILEADVNLQGHNTVNQTNIPIMAHPPDVYSDNSLKEWLEAVLKSKKGIKLDFKSIGAVAPSLDLLREKNHSGINRPVWINADILPGPNVPDFWPSINASQFFGLIQEKFPDVTISPGWKVLYLSIFPSVTYTRSMVEQMYSTVKHLPQKITFPVHALMAKNGWPHLSWLLSQSSRFSLTLWQGKENPTVNDLLFIRDNSNPQRIYYDIYEPVLSQSANGNGLNIQWNTVTDKASLLSVLQEGPEGMLVIPVITSVHQPNMSVVPGSSPELPLQECLDLIMSSKKPLGIFLQIKSKRQLRTTLEILRQAYASDLLYFPTWINMDISHNAFQKQGYISGEEFLKTVDQIFPYVTLAPSWPEETLGEGYTEELVGSMLQLFQGAWQEVSLQLHCKALHRTTGAGFRGLLQAQPLFSLTMNCVGDHIVDIELSAAFANLTLMQADRQRSFYNVPHAYRDRIANLFEIQDHLHSLGKLKVKH